MAEPITPQDRISHREILDRAVAEVNEMLFADGLSKFVAVRQRDELIVMPRGSRPPSENTHSVNTMGGKHE
jgi:hypothetical protein